MADYGLKIWNDSNTIQVGENYRNLQLVSKGTAVTNSVVWTYSRTFITITATSPLLALGQPSGSGYATVGSIVKSGSNWTFEIMYSGALGSSIPYYVFDQKINASTSTYGMRVWRGGELVFDHGWPLLRATAFFEQIFVNPVTGTPYTRSLPTGRTYAYVTAMRCATNYVPPGNPDNEVFYMYGCRNISTGLEIQRFAVEPARFTTSYNYMAVIAIDVTDM